ncbi:MAG: FMN-binding protein [Sedimentisphaerales bacterium]|nr:FMN-binding protein [Sedimentisphaerales bacterium]
MSSKIALFFRESWLLMISSVFFGGLLAITNTAWAPKIAQNEINKFNNLARLLLPTAEKFEPLQEKITLELKGGKSVMDFGGGKSIEADVRKGLDASGNCVGWAFVCEGSGFADKIKLVVAADAQFKTLLGFGVLNSNETPGFGDKINIKDGFYQAQFKGIPAASLTLSKFGDDKKIDSEIIAITGATVTSQSVLNILNQFVEPIHKQLTENNLIHP